MAWSTAAFEASNFLTIAMWPGDVPARAPWQAEYSGAQPLPPLLLPPPDAAVAAACPARVPHPAPQKTHRAPPPPPPQRAYGAIYHSVSVPDISATQYLTSHLLARGLMRKEHLADTTVLHAMLLIDRLMRMQSHNGIHLCKSNVHRVLLSVLLLSAKLLDDETYNNEWWASVGGVTNAHLNELEWYTLSSMDFRLSVTADELDGVRAKLVGRRC